MNQGKVDEILGITRCARCGHRLEGEIECPFCSLFPDASGKRGMPKWVYFIVCFLTSPLSLYSIIKTDHLNMFEKILAFTGCLLWTGLFLLSTSR